MDFLETPTSRGCPRMCICSRDASSCRLCSRLFPKPKPGSRRIFSGRIPASSATRILSVRKALTSRRTFRYSGRSCMVSGSPWMCMMHTGMPARAATSGAPSRCRARTSLIRPAPSCAASAMTSGALVSTEITASSSRAAASTTGHTRSTSSWTETGVAPGLVDSPPMSMKAASSETICLARARAASGRLNWPPSEKESGVTFKTPITWHRDISSSRPAKLIFMANLFRNDKNKRRPEAGRRMELAYFLAERPKVSLLPGRPSNTGMVTIIGSLRLRCCFRLIGLDATGRATTAPTFGRTRFAPLHDVVDLVAVDGFVFHQCFSHQVELLPVIHQNLLGLFVAAVNDVTDLLIDPLGGLRRINRLRLTCRPAQERLFAVGIVLQRTELLRQTPAGHHISCQAGCPFDIVRGAGRDTVKTKGQLFGNAPTKQATDGADQEALAVAVLVLFGKEHGDTQSAATRNNADLVHRIVLRHQPTDNRVARFVVSSVPLFLLAHHHGLALGAHHDLIFGKLELFHGHQALVATGREQSRLVHQVGKVRTREPGRAASNQNRLNTVGQGHFLHVHLEDLLTADDIRQTNHDLTVETARTQQRRVKNVRTVGRGDNDNAFVAFKTVHLNQQLVQGLLTLVVATAHAGTTMATDRVNFVDKDDARALLLGLLEHVANAGRTHTHEHLNEV